MKSRDFTSVEQRIDVVAHRLLDHMPTGGLSGALVEFLVFGLKQAWACLFGGLLLALILASRLFYPEEASLARYDFLFLAALSLQALMLIFRLETWDEAKVILIYHLIGTVMEIFKTQVGSWSYPEENVLRIATVPLFSGFMYAAVGSYLARINRIFDIRYERYPPIRLTLLLSTAIYINFFTHHYVMDMRYLLFVVTAVLFLRCNVHYRVFRFRHKMNLLLGFGLVALFICIAENAATWARIWIYPSQGADWQPVSIGKYGSWYLLMIISFVLLTLVRKPQPVDNTSD